VSLPPISEAKALTILRAAHQGYVRGVGRHPQFRNRPFRSAQAPDWEYLPASDSVIPCYVCPHCGMKSNNLTDLKERFCGRCKSTG
jgi:hypothetical protein